mgnify:CR=1 FL=1
MKRNIPFSPPDISEKEIQLVNEALRSGWITTGPKTKEFEEKISDYIGTSKTVCLNSATACMELTLRLLGVGPGDEVIVPAYTYTASCSVIYHVGATPVMIDSQKDSFEMDYDQMEAAITEKTKVIIPVDLAGVICDYDRIYKAVERKRNIFKPSNEIQKIYSRIIVLADAAHAFGAIKNEKKCGLFADFTSFSFHAVKNLTTAEGGAITWLDHIGVDNDFIYKQFQLLSLHGQTKDALHKNQLGAWEYDIVSPAYKCNMTDIMASIGLAQLDRYEEMLKWRHDIIQKYNEGFSNLPIKILNHHNEEHCSSGHLYLVRVNNISEDERNNIIIKMAEKGVACNVHYKPLPLMTAYKNLGFDIMNYPNAYHLYINEITLPLYSKLTEEEVQYIIDSFQEVIG